jgi:arginase
MAQLETRTFVKVFTHTQTHMISIISNMSELGAGSRGASLGYDALRIASYYLRPDFFKKYKVYHVRDENHMLWEKNPTPTASRIESIATIYERASKLVQEVAISGSFPVLISGDHSNGGANISGIKGAFPDKRLGVIWIDAHADLHSPYTSPSGNVHGMPLASAIGEDNEKMKVKDPGSKAIAAWSRMKGPESKVLPEDIVFMGVRDIEFQEAAIIDRYKIPNFTVEQITMRGIRRVVKQALEHLKSCDLIYLSFDVDSLDPSISRGTGTPVPGGFSREQALGLITLLLRDPRICAFEITEINPLLDDKGNKMGETAFFLLNKAVKEIEKHFKKVAPSEVNKVLL